MVGSSAPCATPNLEDQGISLSLAPPSKRVRYGLRALELYSHPKVTEPTGVKGLGMDAV
jgi:hypothetical protein